MSIATAIANAQARVEAAYDALEAKGATMPATQNLANMPNAIQSIQTGGDESALLVKIKGYTAEDVTLPSGLAYKYALEGLFYYNTNIKYVTIPTNITRIGWGAFTQASSLLRINSSTNGVVNLWEGITELAEYCFRGCSKITSVNIPSTVTTLGGYIFQGCSLLANVDFSSATSLKYINGAYVFRDCTSLTSIDMSAVTLVTTWGANLFQGCTSLVSAVLPPNLTATNSNTFYGCRSLASIRIPDSVTSIGASCFYNCNNLLVIDFGNTRASVPTLSNINAFYTTNATTISDRKIIVPDALYSSWIAANNWKNTTYGIKNQIIAYSDYYN